MTALRVLTANIGFGFGGMDRLVSSIKHHLHIHGWGALTYPFVPAWRGEAAQLSLSKRSAYVHKNQNLGPTWKMIDRINPDALVLNEVMYESYQEELERGLREAGFQTIAWGISTHYPGTSISTMVATKMSGTRIPCSMPQRPSMGGGAGMTGIRLRDIPITVFGVHLTYRSPTLFARQISYIAQVAAEEKDRGNEVVVSGDWNECVAKIAGHPDFEMLDLVSGATDESLTCPTFLPRFLQKPLDHVFVPSNWKPVGSNTIAFGSDHLALAVEIEPRLFMRRNVADEN
jgi:endonuclease/exonuclease/phosphatase family metal-dependent hydrolase